MTTALWPAPTASSPVDAVVQLPGSKSQTNRALVLAALADAPSRLVRPLLARDTYLMRSAVQALGATVSEEGADWVVTPGSWRAPADVDCGLAGTVMRFVPPMAGLASGPVRFDGDPRARSRPMDALLDALRALGVRIQGERLPFVVAGGGGVRGGSVTLDASSSSQYVSGLLLSGARYDLGVTVRHDGKPMPSWPHVAMTVEMLRARGVIVDDMEPDRWRILSGPVSGGEHVIEPDLSNAAPFLAAALVTGGRVVLPGWPERTNQPGDALRQILVAMGGRVTYSGGLVVQGTGKVYGVDLDLHDVGELTPVLAALAALADGPSHFRGVAHLRGHETDRLTALATELSALGGRVEETPDGLRVQPQLLHGGVFRTYDDHRLVTAAAVVGLAVPGVEVENIGAVTKTLPQFAALWRDMLRPRHLGQAGHIPAIAGNRLATRRRNQPPSTNCGEGQEDGA